MDTEAGRQLGLSFGMLFGTWAGGRGMSPERSWYYVRGQVVRVTPEKGSLTVEPQIGHMGTDASHQRLVDIRVDRSTRIECLNESDPATLGLEGLSLGDVVAAEGPALDIQEGRPVLRASWVAREKRGPQE